MKKISNIRFFISSLIVIMIILNFIIIIPKAIGHETDDGSISDGSVRIYNHATSQFEWVNTFDQRDPNKSEEVVTKNYTPTNRIIIDENGRRYRVYRRSLDSGISRAWGSSDSLRPKKTVYHHSWEYYNPK